MKSLRYINWVILLISIPTVQAQQQEGKYLDDTPQDIYNPTTTLFTTQENIQYNQKGYKAIAEDMSISGLHRFTFVQQYGNKLQNLGNNGTATQPIFYRIPDAIGVTSGFRAYDIYFRSPDQFRYYNTKSPYSKLYVILARFGSFYADVCHSRNVTPNWNIGANFRNMMTDKEWIPYTYEPGDRNVISYGIDFFTHYKTANERYQLLANLLIAKHRVRETGGIFTEKYYNSSSNAINTRHTTKKEIWNNSNIKNWFFSEENPKKKNPESVDDRKCFHLYQQYEAAEQLWAYHELSIQKQKNTFKAEALSKRTRFFLGETQAPNTDKPENIETTTALWGAQNEWGVKGDWQDWFYCGYYRHKKTELRPQQEKYNRDLHEHYVGLRTRYQLTDNEEFLHLSGEYLFSGFYKAHVAYEGSYFDLACNRIRHKPSFLAQSYHGYQRDWDQQFTPPTATQISGGFKMEASRIAVKPHVSFTRINNHIYFDHSPKKPEHGQSFQRNQTIAKPKQTNKYADILTLGGALDLSLGAYIHWDSEFTAAKVLGSGAEIIHIPTFLINTKLYYTNTTASGNGVFETGIDVHWKSSYMADGYDPITQQFYLQDAFIAHSYPVIDLFLNFRIKSFRAFLKFSHCNESWLAPAPGYFVTPLYPGQKKAFDIGLSWSFFD